ncbi:MAG: serine/threonine protein kinase [Pirellulaceae bacterium]
MMSGDALPSDRLPEFRQLSPEQARSIDEICDYFEHQLYMHGRPIIEELLGRFRGLTRTVLLRELLHLELEACVSRDAVPEQASYRRRFPGCEELIQSVFDEMFPPTSPATPERVTDPESDAAEPNITNYRILRYLSHGAMGRVYEAIHARLGTRVALKVLRENVASDVEAEAHFEREMRVIGTLSHPNIVSARDAGKSDGRHYLAMDFVDGFDLATIVRRLGTLPVGDACEISRCVALALQNAHEHNLVHRDIKPQNILLGRCPPNIDDVQVKVVDFGVASLRGYVAPHAVPVHYTRIVGTFVYMAPEQYWEQTSDIRSDIYSLGCTLYCLLLGRPPFGRPRYQDYQQIMEAHRSAPVSSVRKLRPDISESLEGIVLSMMAKRPEERVQTPMELAEILSAFAQGHDLENLLWRAQSTPKLESPQMLGNDDAPRTVSVHHGAEMQDPSTQNKRKEIVDTVSWVPAIDPSDTHAGRQDAEHSAPGSLPPESKPRSGIPRQWIMGLDRRRLFLAGLAGVVSLAFLVLFGIGVSRTLWTTSVDLLARVDPRRDATKGQWQFDGQTLSSPDEPFAWLRLDDSPPEQYRLEIEAHRASGGMLVIGLVWNGQQVPVVMNTDSVVLDSADAEEGQSGPDSRSRRFDGGRSHTYTCIVRRNDLLVAYEDEVRYALKLGEEPSQNGGSWRSSAGDRDVLFIGTHNSIFRFTRIVLTPLYR